MLFELLVLFGLVILALLFFAEGSKMASVGVFAGVLLLILSFWLLVDGITIQSGENQITTAISAYDNATNTTTLTTVQNMTYAYAKAPTTSYINMSQLLGFSFLLLSLYFIFRYASMNPS